jgi:ribosome-associated protein
LKRHNKQATKRGSASSKPNSGVQARAATALDDGKQLALAIASAGLDIKAASIEILDVSGKVDYTEFLVLMTGNSDRHVHSIAKAVQQGLKVDHGVMPLSVEGMTAATWVLLDFNDVVVHVFQQSARLFYDLEGLWMDASRVALPAPSVRPPADDKAD